MVPSRPRQIGESLRHASSSGTLDAARVEKAGVSRRQVLARSAVAAGVVWAAPVIKTASAYALTASGTERPCTQFYVAGLTLEENYFPPYPYGFYPPLKKNLSNANGTAQGLSYESTNGTSTSAPTNQQNQGNKVKPHKKPKGGGNGGGGDGGTGDGYGNWDSDAPKIIVPPLVATWGRDNRAVPVLEPDVYPQITQTGAHGWAVLLPEVTGPNAGGRQPRFIIGYSYQGTHFAYGFVDPNPSNPLLKGRRLLFPSPVGNDHEGDDINRGGNGHGRNNSTSSTSSTSTTSTTSTTTPGATTTTTTTRPRRGDDDGGNPFGPPPPTTTSSTTTTSTTTTTMPPPPPPSSTTSTSTTSTSTSTTTSSTTTTTRPPVTTTTTRPKNNQEHGRNSTTTSTTTRPPATTTTTTRPPVTTSSTTTTTTPGSSTTTTSTTSPTGPGGTTTTTSDDPWARWLAAGGPDTRGGGSSNGSGGGGGSAPKLKPFIDTGVGAAGPLGPEAPPVPGRTGTRRFAELFDSEVDGQPVLGAPIKGVVLIYCKP